MKSIKTQLIVAKNTSFHLELQPTRITSLHESHFMYFIYLSDYSKNGDKILTKITLWDCSLDGFFENFRLHPPRLLIAKFSVSGFDDNVLKYMYTYLKSRKQCVHINNVSSEFKYIISGVRRGSINGSILFKCVFNFFSSAFETRLFTTLLMIVLDYQVPGLWTCCWKY